MDKIKFFTMVLNNLKIAVTKNRLDFLITWSNYEARKAGKPHGFNPLNTTFVLKNDLNMSNFNQNAGYPVKNYSTLGNGASATAKTLSLAYYKNIIAAIKADKPLSDTLKTKGVAKEVSIWGSKNFSRQFIDGSIVPKTPNAPPKKNEDNTLKVLGILGLLGLGFILFYYAR